MAVDPTKTTLKETSKSESTNKSTTTGSQTQNQTSTGKSTQSRYLDENLLGQILDGVLGPMTNEEIQAFAENLLRPQLNAGLESAQQQFDTSKLSKEQEIERLGETLARSIAEQNAAYRQNMADVETAALNRGMGRSSYTLQTLANQGSALARAVEQLTRENESAVGRLQEQITQAAQQNAQTQGRLKEDYASSLAAKVQELRESQRRDYNDRYMSAVSSALGNVTDTLGNTVTNSNSTSTTDQSSHSTGETNQETLVDEYISPERQAAMQAAAAAAASSGGGGSSSGSGSGRRSSSSSSSGWLTGGATGTPKTGTGGRIIGGTGTDALAPSGGDDIIDAVSGADMPASKFKAAMQKGK